MSPIERESTIIQTTDILLNNARTWRSTRGGVLTLWSPNSYDPTSLAIVSPRDIDAVREVTPLLRTASDDAIRRIFKREREQLNYGSHVAIVQRTNMRQIKLLDNTEEKEIETSDLSLFYVRSLLTQTKDLSIREVLVGSEIIFPKGLPPLELENVQVDYDLAIGSIVKIQSDFPIARIADPDTINFLARTLEGCGIVR